MSDLYLQSAINEVKDQLGLDTADGQYLNVVSANLGIIRPILGFSDARWRALVKIIALQHKQIKTKFEDALTVLFGPKHTQVTTLAADALTGDTTILLEASDTFPQLGTLILDRGLPVEETVTYDFIDRYTNRAHLTVPLANSHLSTAYGETVLRVPLGASDTTVYVFSDALYPGPAASTPVLIQDHQGMDAFALVTSSGSPHNYLGLAAPTMQDFPAPTAEHVHEYLLRDYIYPSEFLTLTNNDKFLPTGYVMVGESTEYTATGGSITSVTVAAASFTADAHEGYQVQFRGTITSALLGIRAYVVANTDAELTFYPPLAVAPVAGDLFVVLPVVEYDQNDEDQTTLRLKRPIYDLTIPQDSYVEQLGKLTRVKTAQVQYIGTQWDVIQSNPRLVELLLPKALQDVNTIRSASYVHPAFISLSTTLDSGATAGETTLTVVAGDAFPVAGQLVINAGGGTEEYIGYKRLPVVLGVLMGATTTTHIVTTSLALPPILAGNTVYIEDRIQGLSLSRQATIVTATEIDFTDPIPNLLFAKFSEATTQVWYYDPNVFTTAQGTGLVNTHLVGETVEYYNVAVDSTLQSGNVWPSGTNEFSGPYVFSPIDHTTEGASMLTTLNELYSGPTELILETVAGDTALEVADATAMPLSGNFSISIGAETTTRATTTASSVHLKQRVLETVSAPSGIGDTLLDISPFGGPPGGIMPSGKGYRVIVDRGGANEEVVYVLSVDSGASTLTVDPMNSVHAPGETVELLNDVIVVSALTQLHGGRIGHDDRTVRWPVYDWTMNPTIISPIYSSLEVVSTAGLSSTGGTVVLSYAAADQDITSKISTAAPATSTVLVLASTASFPTIYPYEIQIEKGGYLEERALVTFNDTGTNTLTINGGTSGLVEGHPVGVKVSLVPSKTEILSYDSTTLTSLGFSEGIMLDSMHRPAETIIRSSNLSTLRAQGYDFPLRIPSDLRTRLQYIIDLIRAAGIKVNIIESR